VGSIIRNNVVVFEPLFTDHVIWRMRRLLTQGGTHIFADNSFYADRRAM